MWSLAERVFLWLCVCRVLEELATKPKGFAFMGMGFVLEVPAETERFVFMALVGN